MTAKTKASALDNIFGVKPADAIFLPAQPYAVRFNCKSGQLAIGETEFLGDSAEISIVKVGRYFGDLGRTKATEWLQLFFIPAPGCGVLPSNTVCVTYIKTRSLSQFNQTVTRLLGSGQNPALGIFEVSFKRHSAGDRDYYSVAWDWRTREGDAEQKQLEQIAAFMEGGPALADSRVASTLIPIDGLSQQEIDTLLSTARQDALPAAN